MATHKLHLEKDKFYFVTITCYKWIHLLEISNIYDYIPYWFSKLNEKHYQVCGYVIMPNHIHLLLYVDQKCLSLNKTIGEGK